MFISRFGARFLCAVAAACSLGFAIPADVRAEGFAVMENSARGMSLSGGLVARGDDTSVVAYNPAAITRLPGTQFQANLAISMFYWGIDTRDGAGNQTNYHCAHQTWPLPAFYVTHQLNDKWWFGFGSYTRFGLGTKYPNKWAGGMNLHFVQLITQSYTPTIAYKINDMFSVSASAEIMWATMQMNKNLPSNIPLGGGMMLPGPGDININGHGVSFGGSLAVHAKLNEQWSMGLTYRAPMSLKVHGKTRYDNQVGKMFPVPQLAAFQNSKLRGTMHLPDSFTFGVAWKPTEKLSFEADAQYTLWSRFRDFNMYMKSPVNSWANSDKHWENSWTFGISAEYRALDWLALRLGFMYETSPMNYGNADYMVPSNGRNYYTAGLGFYYGNWTLDLAYMYIHNHVLDYTSSAQHGTSGVVPGRTTHPHAHNFGIGIGYKF